MMNGIEVNKELGSEGRKPSRTNWQTDKMNSLRKCGIAVRIYLGQFLTGWKDSLFFNPTPF